MPLDMSGVELFRNAAFSQLEGTLRRCALSRVFSELLGCIFCDALCAYLSAEALRHFVSWRIRSAAVGF